MVYSGQEESLKENVENHGACCDLCTAAPDCRYWTWGSLNKICRLLKTKEYELDQKGFVSGGSVTYYDERLAEAEAHAQAQQAVA
jgi:hypothetical protein